MLDLFGNTLEEKRLNSTRQIVLQGRDLCTTEPRDIERFLHVLQRDNVILAEPIWEPASGYGAISKTLLKYSYEVYSTDMFPYNDENIAISACDFFTCKQTNCKTIFTNPPFNAQEVFLEHALSFGVDVIFFVRLSFLSSIRRYHIYQKYNPAYVYVYSSRAQCYKNGDIDKARSSMIDYCVMIWKMPYKNETHLRWIA